MSEKDAANCPQPKRFDGTLADLGAQDCPAEKPKAAYVLRMVLAHDEIFFVVWFNSLCKGNFPGIDEFIDETFERERYGGLNAMVPAVVFSDLVGSKAHQLLGQKVKLSAAQRREVDRLVSQPVSSMVAPATPSLASTSETAKDASTTARPPTYLFARACS